MKYELVSNTCTIDGSSGLVGFINSAPRPPSTKTRGPMDAMACPERGLGAGPIFWNMYHLWSKPQSGGGFHQTNDQFAALSDATEGDNISVV